MKGAAVAVAGVQDRVQESAKVAAPDCVTIAQLPAVTHARLVAKMAVEVAAFLLVQRTALDSVLLTVMARAIQDV